MESVYIALTAGLLGGFGHCVGMCGPIVAGYSLGGPRAADGFMPRALSHALYNLGRVTTYTAMGAMAGLLGSVVRLGSGMENVQNAVFIVAGVLMVLLGMGSAGIFRAPLRAIEGRNPVILRAIGSIAFGASVPMHYPLGVLMGFMPCGLSYTFVIAAAASSDPLAGAAIMFAFGIGTAPALLLVGAVAGAMGARLRGMLFRASGVLVIMLGLWYVVRGVRAYAAM